MAWPNVGKRVFAYILNRLNLFSTIQLDQLEVTSLWTSSKAVLKDVNIDPARINIPGVKLLSATLPSTTVELKTTGVFVYIFAVQIEASVDVIEPDLALSSILESTTADLAAGVGLDAQESLYDPKNDVDGNISSLSLRMADMALSQLNITLESVSIHLVVCGSVDLWVLVDKVEYSNHQLSISGIEVKRKVVYLDTDESVYYDSRSVVECDDPKRIAFIDSLVLGIEVPLTRTRIALNQIDVDALLVLETFIQVLNLYPFTSTEREPRETQLELEISTINLFEGFEGSPFVVKGLTLASNVLQIESVVFPGLSVSSPFFTADLSSRFDVEVPHPISFSVEPENLDGFMQFISRLVATLALFKSPEASTTQEIQIQLPNIKLELGNTHILLLPGSCTQDSLVLNEIMFTMNNDRLVAESVSLDLESLSLRVGCVRAQLSESFMQPAQELQTATCVFKTEQDSTKETTLSIKIDAIHAQYFDYSLVSELIYEPGCASACVKISYDKSTLAFIADVKLGETKSLNLRNIYGSLHDLDSIRSSLQGLGPHESSGETNFPFKFIASAQGEFDLFPSEVEDRAPLKLKFKISSRGYGSKIEFLVSKVSLALVDTSVVQVAHLNKATLSVSLKDKQISLEAKKLVLSCCADSFAELVTSLGLLASQAFSDTQEETLNMSEESINVFDGVDMAAYAGPSGFVTESSRSMSTSSKLDLVESYYHGSSGEYPIHVNDVLEADLTRLASSTEFSGQLSPALARSLVIIDDYIVPLPAVQEEREGSTWELKVSLGSFIFDLYDGFDFERTRSNISEAVDRVESEISKFGSLSEEDESPLVGDLMYSSIFIGSRVCTERSDTLKSRIDHDLGTEDLHRSKSVKVMLEVKHICAVFGQSANSSVLHCLEITVKDFVVKDLIPTSEFDIILGYHSRAGPRETGSSFVHFVSETVILSKVRPSDTELRLFVEVVPLRLKLDQDTLDFLTRFFGFELESGQAPCQRSVFIQRCEVRDVDLCIDYKPKKVDYASLRSGRSGEFMNFVDIRGSHLRLRHLVVHGVSGFDKLSQVLLGVWAPDVRSTQLGDVLSGLWPVATVVKLGTGVRKLVVIPVREYQRDGVNLTGLQRGTMVFAKVTSSQMSNYGYKLFRGGQKWLSMAERFVLGGASSEDRR